jgi:hypothetical protein
MSERPPTTTMNPADIPSIEAAAYDNELQKFTWDEVGVTLDHAETDKLEPQSRAFIMDLGRKITSETSPDTKVKGRKIPGVTTYRFERPDADGNPVPEEVPADIASRVLAFTEYYRPKLTHKQQMNMLNLGAPGNPSYELSEEIQDNMLRLGADPAETAEVPSSTVEALEVSPPEVAIASLRRNALTTRQLELFGNPNFNKSAVPKKPAEPNSSELRPIRAITEEDKKKLWGSDYGKFDKQAEPKKPVEMPTQEMPPIRAITEEDIKKLWGSDYDKPKSLPDTEKLNPKEKLRAKVAKRLGLMIGATQLHVDAVRKAA